MKQQEFTVTFSAVAASGLLPPQIQFHMVSVCAANYLQLKEFQERCEAFLHLVVSAFIPMISFTVRARFMTQFLYGEENLLFFNVGTAGAINGNVNTRRIHLFFKRPTHFPSDSRKRLHCFLDITYTVSSVYFETLTQFSFILVQVELCLIYP